MNKLFIVDLMPFLYKGHFVFLRNPRITSSGINTSALLGLANGLLSILKKENPSHLVLAMDPGGKTFRHEMYAPYKAQRQKMPEDLAASIPYAFELAEALKIPVVRVDGYEADDVMGTLAVKGAEQGFDVYLATPDKDAAQLVRQNIKLYRPAHAGDAATIYDEKSVCEHWHLSHPAQMIDYLALAGDTADNIPGIRGVGEKTAIDLLSRFGTVEEILNNASQLKGKLAEKVASSREDALISKVLTTIKTDVPISPDWESFKRDGVDNEKLSAVCTKFELTRFAKEFSLTSNQSATNSQQDRPVQNLTNISSTPHDYRLITTEDEARELLNELMTYSRIAFDTETAAVEGHDSTEPHFCKLVGFSFATAPGKAWYVTADQIDVFRPLFADPTKTFVGHNVKFDMSVLLRYGIGFASVPHDTLLTHYCMDAAARHGMDALAEQYLNYQPIPITRLIGEKLRGQTQLSMAALKPVEICDYAAEDADVTLRLDDALRNSLLSSLPTSDKIPNILSDVEEPLVPILIDMEREGVKIDVESLKDYGRILDKDLLSLEQEIRAYAQPGFNVDSPKQLGQLLFEDLKLPSAKKTATGQYSTDEKTLSKLLDAHPIISKILEYRTCSKLKSTYVDKLPLLIDDEQRVHTTYEQAFTETGRLSSSNPNLQNIPIRTERGKFIRKAFVARDKDHKLLSADYSQIELRLMAAFSQDESMISAFKHGEDIHRETASRVYDILPGFVTPEQRAACKMVNFGIIYGISAFGLSQRLNISKKEASNLIETYFKLYPKIKNYMTKAIEEARKNGYATTFLGRRRTLRDINSQNATVRQAAERDAINTPVQGSAADLVKVAMVKINRAIKEAKLHAKMVLQIHDELVFDTPTNEVEALSKIVRNEMINALDFGVPLDVGIGIGDTWLEAH